MAVHPSVACHGYPTRGRGITVAASRSHRLWCIRRQCRCQCLPHCTEGRRRPAWQLQWVGVSSAVGLAHQQQLSLQARRSERSRRPSRHHECSSRRGAHRPRSRAPLSCHCCGSSPWFSRPQTCPCGSSPPRSLTSAAPRARGHPQAPCRQLRSSRVCRQSTQRQREPRRAPSLWCRHRCMPSRQELLLHVVLRLLASQGSRWSTLASGFSGGWLAPCWRLTEAAV